jgi:Tol biopolymer transport system component/DNA-binding winged helix-turn-helix (wHTH) protein
MESCRAPSRKLRFGVFEADLASHELRKRGRNVALQDQPFQVLALLLRHAGEIVTREELQHALWPADTFIEFEQGVNTAIKKLRQALGDSAVNPRFIETLPKRGYRFIAPVADLVVSDALPDPPVLRRTLRRWVAATGVAALAAGCVFWVVGKSSRTVPVPLAVPLTSDPGWVGWASFSPEGDRVAFARAALGENKRHVYVKQIGTEETVPLTSDSSDHCCAAWSPDGRWIAFLRRMPDQTWALFRIPAIGGTARKVTDVQLFHAQRRRTLAVEDGRIAWHPGGQWLVVSDQGSAREPLALFLVSAETGEKRKLTFPPDVVYPRAAGDWWPAFSPDGRALAFSRGISDAVRELYLIRMSDDLRVEGEPTRITFLEGQAIEPAWWPDGENILFASGRTEHSKTLWKMAVHGRRPGRPERVPFGGEAQTFVPAISRQGRIAYRQLQLTAHIWRMELGGSHQAIEMPMMNSTRLEHVPQYSPDGKRIAFASNRSGTHEIWLCNADGSNAAKLTSFGGPDVGSPAWSPDGRRIVFDARPGGRIQIHLVSADGGKSERLAGSEREFGAGTWSRDGTSLYLPSSRSKGKTQIWSIPVNGGAARQITQGGGAFAAESPDRRFVFFVRSVEEGATTELWRVPAEGGEEVRIADNVAAQFFSVNERGVYFFSGWRSPKVQCYNFASKTVETVGKVEGLLAFGMTVSPDSRYVLYSLYGPDRSDLMMVEGYRP